MNALDKDKIGKLRERVELNSKIQTIGGSGGHQVSFILLASVWAKVNAIAGTPSYNGDGRSAKATHTVIVRHRTDVKPGDQIVYRTRSLEVLSVQDLDGRKAFISCRCQEIVSIG